MQPKYATRIPETVVKRAFRLLGLSQKAARNRLSNRPSWAAISLWNAGKRRIPKWAASAIAHDMRSKAAELNAGATELEASATDGRRRGSTALAAWRASRARAKEKASE
jgi:hypothetical protein